MDLKIIQETALNLFNSRGRDVYDFWTTSNPVFLQRTLATAKLMDGDSKPLENLISMGKHTNLDLYNLSCYFQNDHKKRNYYKNGIKDKKFLLNVEKQKRSNKVAIFIPHAVWTGGVKMIFKLGDMLTERGYQVDYFIPYNTTLERHQLQIGPETREVITYSDDDSMALFAMDYEVAFATHWDQIYPLYRHFKKAVFYSQGDYDTFSNKQEKINLLKQFYSLPIFHMGVSSFLTHLMSNNYGRKAWIVPNGIDRNKFFYDKNIRKQNYLLVIGDATNVFKNTKETIEHLIPIAEKHNLQIKWVTPNQGNYPHPLVETIVNPPQDRLVRLYQEATVYINGSLIEAFSLPPLEAMSCGTPVVASNNMGILQYAQKDINALLFPFKQYQLMQEYVEKVVTDKGLSERLIEKGLETAIAYEENIMSTTNLELIENEFLKSNFFIDRP